LQLLQSEHHRELADASGNLFNLFNIFNWFPACRKTDVVGEYETVYLNIILWIWNIIFPNPDEPLGSCGDECTGAPCENGGKCLQGVNEYTCDCLPGHTGDNCEADIDECASVDSNSCNPVNETCSNIVGGFRCFPNAVCDVLGTGTCTEPFDGFFDELAKQGSFGAPSMNKEAFVNWMKNEVWESLSMETILEDVPPQYTIVATENATENVQSLESEGHLLLDGFLDFLLSNNTFSPYDLVALQAEFNFSYTARRLNEFNKRVLATSQEQCKEILTESVVDVLILCFDAIGIDQAIGEKLVGPLVQAHRNTLETAFATQFVQHDGLTKGFIASVFIAFLTTVEWWEIEETIQQEFTGVEVAAILLNTALKMMTLFTTGGWVAVAKVDAALAPIFSVFDNVKDILQNDCFGDTIVQGCEDFYESGGFGLTTSTVNMGQNAGKITLTYDMYSITDEIEVFYEGERIYWSGGLVSGAHTVDLSYGPGESQIIVVRVSAPNAFTAWEFSVSCPAAPIDPVTSFTYSSIKNTIVSKGYDFFNGEYDLNLVGIRSPTRIVGAWDDTFCVLYKDEQGEEQIFKSEHFTTDPGDYYMTKELLSDDGCAIVTPGQHKGVWKIGLHRNKYKALIQVGAEISVYRDDNLDTTLDMNPSTIQTGWFGINLHHGYGSATVGRNSAGCQVFRDEADLLKVLDLAEKQVASGHGGTFSYTLLDEEDLPAL